MPITSFRGALAAATRCGAARPGAAGRCGAPARGPPGWRRAGPPESAGGRCRRGCSCPARRRHIARKAPRPSARPPPRRAARQQRQAGQRADLPAGQRGQLAALQAERPEHGEVPPPGPGGLDAELREHAQGPAAPAGRPGSAASRRSAGSADQPSGGWLVSTHVDCCTVCRTRPCAAGRWPFPPPGGAWREAAAG